MNNYWLPNVDINKKVITQELPYYLGPGSHIRPYTREGEDGFLITTSGPCLTDEQIDDICRKSKDVWEKQAAARSKNEAEKTDGSEKKLKRPLHQPILVPRAPPVSNSRRRDDGRRDDSRRQRSGERRDSVERDRRRSGESGRRDDRRW